MKMVRFSGIKFAAGLAYETHNPLPSHEIRRKRIGRQIFSTDAKKKIASCKFFGDGTGQSMKTHARVDFPRVKQTNTQEVSRWHASASPWKTTMAARSMAIRSASMTCLEGQRA